MRKKISRRRFVDGSIRLALVTPLVHLTPLDALAQTAAVKIGRVERRTLAAAVDVIIPAQGPMPAASAVGAVRYLERVAGADEKLGQLLLDGLRAIAAHTQSTHSVAFELLADEPQTAVLAHFEKVDTPPGFFAALRDLVYESYYSQPVVWRLIGYDFRTGRRSTADVEPFDERRLARVRKMKPFYREIRS
jgi:hypothetical protein